MLSLLSEIIVNLLFSLTLIFIIWFSFNVGVVPSNKLYSSLVFLHNPYTEQSVGWYTTLADESILPEIESKILALINKLWFSNFTYVPTKIYSR